jgi:DNA-binding transcriptional LysR family regulator
MLVHLRSFITVIEEGSLHRAAERLHLSQSTLSRQMQALEAELGGRLLERTSTGVRPTNGGHALAAKAGALLASYEGTMVEVRRLLRGESEQLRIGFVGSAAHDYLNPALARLRRTYPAARLLLLDLSPGEQITALRRGEIDVALTDQGAELLSLDFFTRKLTAVSSVVILPTSHPLAAQRTIRIAQLKNETFVNGLESDTPGYNRRIIQCCRRFGKFRPKFIGHPGSLAEGLDLVANDDTILLLPRFVRHRARQGVTMRPVAEREPTWDIVVAWQPGRMTGALLALLDAFAAQGAKNKKQQDAA